MGGQIVEMRRKKLYVDGVSQDETYAKHTDPRYVPRRDDFGPYEVPEGHFFMMGDNRDCSNDSRFLGAIPMRCVEAKAEVLYFSWNLDRFRPRLGRIAQRIR